MFPFKKKSNGGAAAARKEEKSQKKSEWVPILDPTGRPCWQHAESGHITYGNSFAAPQQGYNPAKPEDIFLESPPDSPNSSKPHAAHAPSLGYSHASAHSPTHSHSYEPPRSPTHGHSYEPPRSPTHGHSFEPPRSPTHGHSYEPPRSPTHGHSYEPPRSPTHGHSHAPPQPHSHHGGAYPPYLQQAPVSPAHHFPESPVGYLSPVPYGASPVAVYPMAPWNTGSMPVSPVPQQVPTYLKKQSTEAEKAWKKQVKEKKEKELRAKEAKGTWEACYDEDGYRYFKNTASGRRRETDPYI